MQIHYLTSENSLLNTFMAQLRDKDIQKDAMRFRKNLERIGSIMAYEVSKTLAYQTSNITTPLGEKRVSLIKEEIVLCSILRAGLALHTGFMNFFDDAANGFISASRTHGSNNILVEYQAMPSINGKCVLLLDPMLATGHSLVAVYNKLVVQGLPKEVHICVVIAAPEGIEYAQKHLPSTCHFWIVDLDEKLNDNNYIVPGLGDAGDLTFGEKL